MEQLYELSRSTLLINLHQPPGPQLTQLILRIFAVEGVAIFDASTGQCARAGVWSEDEMDLAKECFLLSKDNEDSMTRTTRRQLRINAETIGALVIRGDLSPLVGNALASLGAIALDRCVSFEKESRIEAAHQAERLRAAVLDSLAHAVKTPLTAIQTANEGLREVGKLNNPQKELVTLIEEESNQLGQLCTRLLQTAWETKKSLSPTWSQWRCKSNRDIWVGTQLKLLFQTPTSPFEGIPICFQWPWRSS
jgi:two-component system sensor histidine kinase KdpD